MSEKKKHMVHHHNMFGPSCQTPGGDWYKDFEIYCHKEHRICAPKKCDKCEYFGGSEMGYGICCVWEETYDAIDTEHHTVPCDEAYFEFQRVENPEVYKMMMQQHESDDFDLCKAWLDLD